MIRKAKRYFNTSGPNQPEKHYTLNRELFIKKGIQLVRDERYFTIWAPRQTGKSTYFRMLAKRLEPLGYQVLHINVENFKRITEEEFLQFLAEEFQHTLGIETGAKSFAMLYNDLKRLKGRNKVPGKLFLKENNKKHPCGGLGISPLYCSCTEKVI